MPDNARELRDQVVRALARLSLIMLLALMGALFVGGAAVGGSPEEPRPTPATESMLETASPAGLVLGAVVLSGGLLVLMVGVLRPERADQRQPAHSSLY